MAAVLSFSSKGWLHSEDGPVLLFNDGISFDDVILSVEAFGCSMTGGC